MNRRTDGEQHGGRTWLTMIAGAALIGGLALAGCQSSGEAEAQADAGDKVPAGEREPQGEESMIAIPSGQEVVYEDGRLAKPIPRADYLTDGQEAAIELHSGANGGGRLVGTTNDAPKVIVFPMDEDWADNSGASVRLRNVKAGTVVRLYDNPGVAVRYDEYGDVIGYYEDPPALRLSEDWVEIQVKHSVEDYTVPSLESQYYDKYVNVVWYRDSHIIGKVSRLEVARFDPALLPYRPTQSNVYLQPESTHPALTSPPVID